MPQPTTPMSFDFDDSPGGDLLLDDIFNVDGADSNTQVPTEPQQKSEPETFLKTSTGTVYKSADDAVKGIEHKDALISQLRQQLAAQTGKDPIKPKDDPNLTSYLENPQKYFADIKGAKTEQELLNVQSKFVQENLQPYAGLIASVAKSRAVEEVAAEIPEITTFLKSDDYRQTIEKFPLLKRSIEISESNPQVSGDLGQLYRMAYSTYAGNNLSKFVQQPARVAEARPTVSSTTPLAPNGQRTAAPSMESKAGRQSIIEQQEARGVQDLRF